MKKIVFMFDGQGAFKPGVGKDLYHRYASAKKLIDNAGAVLGFDLVKHLWGEEAAKTSGQTSIAQPAISAVSLAYAQVLKDLGVEGEISLGHSLGEATAIVYCGALPFDEGIGMIQKRGLLMEKGGKDGGMMAVINIDTAMLEKECARVSEETKQPVVVANINAPNQVVISGSMESIKLIAQFAAQNHGRGIPLDVGGAWHSPYLNSASHEFTGFLDTLKFGKTTARLYSVVEHKVQTSGAEIRESFKKQMLSQVNWVKAVESLKGLGYTTILEIGPSKILKDLIAKIDPGIRVESVALFTELETFIKNL
ncbi:MAG TPA: ACP S-malonyltransferase [bacterium]